MRIFFLIGLLILSSVSAFAIPSNNVLWPVDSIKTQSKKLIVKYTLPCTSDDFSELVFMSDDSGDMAIGAAVVYSTGSRNCRSDGKTHQFIQISNNFPAAERYESLDV